MAAAPALEFMLSLRSRGDVVRIQLCGMPVYVLTHSALADQVLSRSGPTIWQGPGSVVALGELLAGLLLGIAGPTCSRPRSAGGRSRRFGADRETPERPVVTRGDLRPMVMLARDQDTGERMSDPADPRRGRLAADRGLGGDGRLLATDCSSPRNINYAPSAAEFDRAITQWPNAKSAASQHRMTQRDILR